MFQIFPNMYHTNKGACSICFRITYQQFILCQQFDLILSNFVSFVESVSAQNRRLFGRVFEVAGEAHTEVHEEM